MQPAANADEGEGVPANAGKRSYQKRKHNDEFKLGQLARRVAEQYEPLDARP